MLAVASTGEVAREILHAVFAIAGPLVTLIGVVLSVWGTFLFTEFWHPFTGEDFFVHLKDSPILAMTLLRQVLRENREPIRGDASANPLPPDEGERKLEELKVTAQLAVNEEKRYASLVGLDMVFVGFALQAIGAISSLADIAWTQYDKIAALLR
jgi:hypothetical protein